MIALKKPQIGNEELKAVERVLQSGAIAQGVEVASFEEEFSAYCDVDYSIAVNSGTAALHTILSFLNLSAEDEVITSPFSFVATLSPVLMCGAKPVFASIDKKTFNIDVDSVENCITNKTKAIIAVNLYGLCADWKKLRKLAEKYNIFLIEDAAQSHGAEVEGSVSGSLGDAAAFSFYATKNMTTAEGGMITTCNPDLAAYAQRFRQHGMSTVGQYRYAHLGYNYRSTDIAAAIGRSQLKKVPDWTRKRREIANFYDREFSCFDQLVTPLVPEGYSHAYHLYTLKVPSAIRDQIVHTIRGLGVGCGVYYPQPLYEVGLTPDYRHRVSTEPVEGVCKEVISIPCEPYLDLVQCKKVIECVVRSIDA